MTELETSILSSGFTTSIQGRGGQGDQGQGLTKAEGAGDKKMFSEKVGRRRKGK